MSRESRTRPVRGWSMVGWGVCFAILAVLALGFAVTGSTSAVFGVAGVALLFGAVVLEVHRRGSSRLSVRSAAPSAGDSPNPSSPADLATVETPSQPGRTGPDGVHFQGRRQSFLVLFARTVGGLISAGIAGLSAFAFVYGALRGHFGLAVVPGMLFAVPAWGILRGVVAHLWSGISARPRGVWLTEHGVIARLDLRTVQLPWSNIAEIRTATTSLGRGFSPRVVQNWVHIVLAGKQEHPQRNGWRERIGLRRPSDIAVAVTQVHLEHNLRLLYIGLSHYLHHPADRTELRSRAEAAITRIETAAT